MGDKNWVNAYTEVEVLGGGVFRSSITPNNRVFKDKVDGVWKAHKVTSNSTKGCVIIQSANCCVEVYPYYATFFDVNHEEVRLTEEAWVVQRLFRAPDTWRDVSPYNPITTIEETNNSIAVIISYTTDYGPLIIKYIQRDGLPLKHEVSFSNTSSKTETFRVTQRWTGIMADECNGQEILEASPLATSSPFLSFHRSNKPQKELSISENLHSAMYDSNDDPTNPSKLQLPVYVTSDAQGKKASFVYGGWVLQKSDSLLIDPATATLNNPTVDGFVYDASTQDNTALNLRIGFYSTRIYRSYVEWDVTSIPDTATIIDTVFQYNGKSWDQDCHIHEMLGQQPSIGNANADYTEAGEGTVYADVAGFPVAGVSKSIDLGADADTDLKKQLAVNNWFAIGLQADVENGSYSIIYPEEATPTPVPTLYVTYSVANKGSVVPIMIGFLEGGIFHV